MDRQIYAVHTDGTIELVATVKTYKEAERYLAEHSYLKENRPGCTFIVGNIITKK